MLINIVSSKGSTPCREYVRIIEVYRIYFCPSEALVMDVATPTSVMLFAQMSVQWKNQ